MVLALLAAQPWAELIAAPPAAPANIDTASARAAAAAELVRLMSPRAELVGSAMRAIEHDFPVAMLADPNLATLEKQYPGLLKAIVAAMLPKLRQVTEDEVTRLWAKLTPLYADAMSLPELTDAARFYGSALGIRLIKGNAQFFDYKPVFSKIADDPEATISVSSINEGQMTGVVKVVAAMSTQERQALLDFAATPAGRKITQLRPEMLRLTAENMNQAGADDTEFEALVINAMNAYMAAHDSNGARQTN